MSVDEGKGFAILAYISWVGWLIAFIINNQDKNNFASFHLRQALGIMIGQIATVIGGFILAFILMIIIPFVGMFMAYGIILMLMMFWFIMWLMGLIYAITGAETPIPLFGGVFQRWFRGI